jgi:hypothetical protein
MPDMKWMSAAVYGRMALSALAFAMAALSPCPLTGFGSEDETVPPVALLQAVATIAVRRAAVIPRLK